MSERRKITSATALGYEPAADSAPRVVASGRGEVADRIIALAVENGIPIREDENLAQLLEALDVDMDIPPTLYRAVAEVLVFVYRLNGMMVAEEAGDTGHAP